MDSVPRCRPALLLSVILFLLVLGCSGDKKAESDAQIEPVILRGIVSSGREDGQPALFLTLDSGAKYRLRAGRAENLIRDFYLNKSLSVRGRLLEEATSGRSGLLEAIEVGVSIEP
jgi:hypothetical protein